MLMIDIVGNGPGPEVKNEERYEFGLNILLVEASQEQVLRFGDIKVGENVAKFCSRCCIASCATAKRAIPSETSANLKKEN